MVRLRPRNLYVKRVGRYGWASLTIVRNSQPCEERPADKKETRKKWASVHSLVLGVRGTRIG